MFKVFVSTRKVAAHDYYRFAAWFLGSVLFNTILQGIVMPFATSDCTPEKASILVTGLGILAFTGHVLLYSYSLDRLVGWLVCDTERRMRYELMNISPRITKFIVWPNLKKYSRLRPLVAGIISIPGFLMYAVGYNYDGPMSEIIESCSTTPK